VLKTAMDVRPSYQPFAAEVNGASFEKHGEAGEAFKQAAMTAIETKGDADEIEIGKLYGKLPVLVVPTREGYAQFVVRMGQRDQKAGTPHDPRTLEHIDAVGLSRSLDMAIQRVPSDLQAIGSLITTRQNELAAAERKYGAPFPEESQLSDAVAERNQLQAEMAAETKAKDNPPPPPAPDDTQASALAGEETTGPPLTNQELEDIWQEAAIQLRKIMPKQDINLHVAAALTVKGEPAAGFYRHSQRLIALAANIEQNRHWVLAHESVHAMKALGLFSPGEWSLLVREAWTKNPKMQEQVRKRWEFMQYPSEESLHEEAVAEFFGDHFSYTEGEGWKGRLARRVLNFLVALARAFNKFTGKGNMEAINAHRVLELMRKGVVGSREPGSGEQVRGSGLAASPDDVRASATIAPPAPASPDFGGDSERRYQEARKGIGDGPSALESAKAWWEDLTGGFTRHWRALPNSARFADVSQQFRKLEAAPHAAMTESVRFLRSLVGNMNAKEYDLFSRKVLLDDLAWDAGEGRDLPFGLTPTTLKGIRSNVDAMVGLSPKLVAAIRARKAYVKSWSDAAVMAGVLTRDQVKNPAYFRHMVLDYARHEAKLAHGPNKVKSPYWAKRMGSTLDINANYLEAELDWLQKMQIDIATADTLEHVKNSEHNIRDQLRDRARSDNKAALAVALAGNPAAAKEDGWFRSNIARGFALVKDEIEAGNLDPIPAQLQAQADSIVSGSRAGDPPFALMAWILDGSKPGSMGAGMVLKYTGLRKAVAAQPARRQVGRSGRCCCAREALQAGGLYHLPAARRAPPVHRQDDQRIRARYVRRQAGGHGFTRRRSRGARRARSAPSAATRGRRRALHDGHCPTSLRRPSKSSATGAAKAWSLTSSAASERSGSSGC
jgi:hypothetical protein